MRTAASPNTRDLQRHLPETGTMDIASAVAVWSLLSVLGWGVIALVVKLVTG